MERFREHFTEKTLTRPLMISCLENAVRSDQAGSQMGGAAIMWLWWIYDSIEYPGDSDLLNPIAILLVREGKEELLWDWMKQEPRKPVNKADKYDKYNHRYMWRTEALQSLVEAKAHLTPDRSLDAALEAFFRGTKVPYHLFTQEAANFCHKVLACTRTTFSPHRSYRKMREGLAFANTNLELWDAFYTEMGKRPGSSAKESQATMRLHHPQHPDPWPLFKFWRQAEHDQNHSLHRVKSRPRVVARTEGGRDMQLVLKHLGYREAAAWTKKFAKELFPRDRRPKEEPREERLTVDGKPLSSL
jgi:hypothetical protein